MGSASAPESCDEAEELLLSLVQALHSVQVPADVVEEVVTAGAKRFGLRADLVLFQSYAGLELRGSDRAAVALRRIPFNPSWELSRARALVILARRIADGTLGVAEAHAALDRLLSEKSPYPPALVWLGYAVYGAAVAARIGGGWHEVAIAGLVGAVAGFIHYGAARSARVDLLQSFLAGLLGATVSLFAARLTGSLDLPRALFGGMTLLVPAMVITIGTHEMANSALESGAMRLGYGLLRFLMLGFGIAAALKLWMAVLEVPPHGLATPLPLWQVFALLVVGGAALIFCLQARGRDAPWIIGAVMFAYGAQTLCKAIFGEEGAPLATAFVLGVAGYLQAMLPGHVPATVIAPGLLQIAPGFLGLQSTLNLLAGRPEGEKSFFQVAMVALQLVTGLMLASMLLHRRGGPLRRRGSARPAA